MAAKKINSVASMKPHRNPFETDLLLSHGGPQAKAHQTGNDHKHVNASGSDEREYITAAGEINDITELSSSSHERRISQTMIEKDSRRLRDQAALSANPFDYNPATTTKQ